MKVLKKMITQMQKQQSLAKMFVLTIEFLIYVYQQIAQSSKSNQESVNSSENSCMIMISWKFTHQK